MATTCIAGLVALGFYLQPKRLANCSSFGSYDAAKKAYDLGAVYLDKGGRPGIPCESLLPKSVRAFLHT